MALDVNKIPTLAASCEYGKSFSFDDKLTCVWCGSEGKQLLSSTEFNTKLLVPEDGNGQHYCHHCTRTCKNCNRSYHYLSNEVQIQEQFAICDDCYIADVHINNGVCGVDGINGTCIKCNSSVVGGCNGNVYPLGSFVKMAQRAAYCGECTEAGFYKRPSALWTMVHLAHKQ